MNHLRLDADSPSDFDVRLTLVLRRVSDQVVVQSDKVFRIQDDHCTSSVEESAQALTSADLYALFDASIVPHAPHEHCSNCNNRHGGPRWPVEDHYGSSIFAIHVQCALLIDRLWVDCIVASLHSALCPVLMKKQRFTHVPGISVILAIVPAAGACQRW